MALFGNKQQQIGSTQDALKFSEIHDGVVILKDGNLRQIILCTSVNFSLKSEQEQTAIVFQYQTFLNSLDFPIQILMQSKRIDLTNYIANLEKQANKQTNELLHMQTVDYIDFIKRLINIANIMDKRFYVIVPYLVPVKINTGLPGTKGAKNVAKTQLTTNEFSKYKKELDQRVQVISSGLGSIGIRSALLNTQQVIELLYGVYNPEESNKQKITNTDELKGEVVEAQLKEEPKKTEV